MSDLIEMIAKMAEAAAIQTGKTGGGIGDFFGNFLSMFSGGGGGLGSSFADIGGGAGGVGEGLQGLSGFANGGSFIVPGLGGIDTELLSIGRRPAARVSPGERIIVENPSNSRTQAATTTYHFDLRGSFVPEDLIERARAAAGADTMRIVGGTRRKMATAQRQAMA